MKEQEVREKFLQLRAEGISFEKISKMVKVSKPTLVEWGKEYKKQIEEFKVIRYEQILEKYKATRENRIERIAKELQIAWKNYESKDYKDLSKKEIFNMIAGLERRLREETEPILNPKRTAEEEEPEDYKIDIYHDRIYRDEKTNEVMIEKAKEPFNTVYLKPIEKY